MLADEKAARQDILERSQNDFLIVKKSWNARWRKSKSPRNLGTLADEKASRQEILERLQSDFYS